MKSTDQCEEWRRNSQVRRDEKDKGKKKIVLEEKLKNKDNNLVN